MSHDYIQISIHQHLTTTTLLSRFFLVGLSIHIFFRVLFYWNFYCRLLWRMCANQETITLSSFPLNQLKKKWKNENDSPLTNVYQYMIIENCRSEANIKIMLHFNHFWILGNGFEIFFWLFFWRTSNVNNFCNSFIEIISLLITVDFFCLILIKVLYVSINQILIYEGLDILYLFIFY